MAKCPICSTKKGKRQCLINEDPVCSLCCGKTRTDDLCIECNFYQKPKRKYNAVPAYSTTDMSNNMDLESYGNAIEGALCSYDIQNENILKDNDAIRIIELLMDMYHFNDLEIDTDKEIIRNGVKYLDKVVKIDLQDVNIEKIVKILGVIYFVAKRRTKMGSEYMNIIHQYVGQRVDTGIRTLRM